MASDVYISYAREDSARAKKIYDDLKNAGIKPWLDAEDILPGHIRETVIRQAIRDSKFFLTLLSTNALSRKGYVHKEIKLGLDMFAEYSEDSIYIIPASLDESKATDETLRQLEHVDLSDYPKGFARLLKVLKPDTEIAVSVEPFQPFPIKPEIESFKNMRYVIIAISIVLIVCAISYFYHDFSKLKLIASSSSSANHSQANTQHSTGSIENHFSGVKNKEDILFELIAHQYHVCEWKKKLNDEIEREIENIKEQIRLVNMKINVKNFKRIKLMEEFQEKERSYFDTNEQINSGINEIEILKQMEEQLERKSEIEKLDKEIRRLEGTASELEVKKDGLAAINQRIQS